MDPTPPLSGLASLFETTIGQFVEARRTESGTDCPSKEIMDIVIRALYDNGPETPMFLALELQDSEKRIFTLIERWSHKYKTGQISTAVEFLLSSCASFFGVSTTDQERPLPTVSRLCCSTRAVDPSLQPDDHVSFEKLFSALGVISLEHHLLHRLGHILQVEQTKRTIRHELLTMGCHYPSIPNQPIEDQIPEYPKEIPWPILFLRCKLAHEMSSSRLLKDNPEKFRQLITRIILARARFPRHEEDLKRIFLEAQYLECTSFLRIKWNLIVHTLKELRDEKEKAGPLVEWPLPLTTLLEQFSEWVPKVDALTQETTLLFLKSPSSEEKLLISDRWDALLEEFEGRYNEIIRLYEDRANQDRTKVVYVTNYEKVHRHLIGLKESKQQRHLARRGCGVKEFVLKTERLSLFGGERLRYLTPDELFIERLSSTPPNRLFLLSEQERESAEKTLALTSADQKAQRRDFLPSHVQLGKAVACHPRTHKKAKPTYRHKQWKAPSEGSAEREEPVAAPPEPTTKHDKKKRIHIGEGPEAYHYAWSVRRWAFEDPFTSDPTYRDPQYPPHIQQAITFEHTFAHVVHKLCFLFGAQFEQRTPDKHVEMVIYTLPGEVTWDDGRYEKVVFEICYSPKTKKIFHAFATAKTPKQLAQRYAERHCFHDEDRLLTFVPEVDTKGSADDFLPDDMGRVTDFSLEEDGETEDFLEVRDTKHEATYRLYRFQL